MVHGHWWTIRRHLEVKLAAPRVAGADAFRLVVPDPRFGEVALGGQLNEVPGASEVVVLVHGLGGSSRSGYVLRAARAALDLGMSCLRLDLRGADLGGEDLYHAGLTSDLAQVLGSSVLARYERRYLFGFSLGGHLCLRYAADYPDGPCDAIAAVTAPVHLEAGAALFDAQPAFPYRWHVMRGLFAMYRAYVARRGPWPISLEAARALTKIRQFDEAIIAPRFGYADAGDYYHDVSVSRVAQRIKTRTLLLRARHDPMVPGASVEPALAHFPNNVRLMESVVGGHVAFPRDLSLGQLASLGVETQVLAWLRGQGDRG